MIYKVINLHLLMSGTYLGWTMKISKEINAINSVWWKLTLN